MTEFIPNPLPDVLWSAIQTYHVERVPFRLCHIRSYDYLSLHRGILLSNRDLFCLLSNHSRIDLLDQIFRFNFDLSEESLSLLFLF